MRQLYLGDCLSVMREKIEEESVDLIYLDPPFAIGVERVSYDDQIRFDDAWSGGIVGYLDWLRPRLAQIVCLLKNTGSLYVHLDYHACHYVKVELDRILGIDNFRREIVWRIGWISGYKTKAKNWIRNHDTILYYTKSDQFTFNKQYITRVDQDSKTEKKLSIEDTWNCSADDVLHSPKIMSFVPSLYPTQKPLALLERIIRASSNEDDLILDPFCGSGTTLLAADKLGRRWIGIDNNPDALEIVQKRLNLAQSKLL